MKKQMSKEEQIHWANQHKRIMNHPIMKMAQTDHFEIWATSYSNYVEKMRLEIVKVRNNKKHDPYRWSLEHIRNEIIDTTKVAIYIQKFQKLVANYKKAKVTLDIRNPSHNKESFFDSLFTNRYREDITKKETSKMWTAFKPHVGYFFNDKEDFHKSIFIGSRYLHRWVVNRETIRSKINRFELDNKNTMEFEHSVKGGTDGSLHIKTFYTKSLIAKGRLQFPLSCLKFALRHILTNTPRHKQEYYLVVGSKKLKHSLKLEFEDEDEWESL